MMEFMNMGEEAIALHEMFLSFLQGGFTEEQATRLCAAVIVEGGRRAREEQEQAQREHPDS